MTILLDTSVILWAALHPERISRAAAEAITDPGARRFLSPLSMYEIAQKTARGKLDLPLPPAAFVEDSASRMRLEWLPLTDRHLLAIDSIPWAHRDPFDRMLAVQALVEDIPIVSPDRQFDSLGIRRIW